MATLFVRRQIIHIDFWKDGKRIRENLNLKSNEENWKRAQKIKEEIEYLYEKENYKYLIPSENLQSKNKNEVITLLKAIEKYDTHLSLKSLSHQNGFKNAINHFMKCVNENIYVEKINSEHIVSFIKRMKEELSNGTVRTYYTYIRLFFNFLVKEDIILKSPCRNVKSPPEEEKEIILFKESVLQEIFEGAKRIDLQFYNVLVMLSLTGLRPIDLLNLKSDNIDLEEEVIKVKISKTRNFKMIPLYKDLKNFINNNLSYIFDKDEKIHIFKGYNVNMLGQKFRRLKRRLGMKNDYSLTLKTFRKTMASTLLNNGVRLEFVSYILGHKKLQTTRKYYAKPELENVRCDVNEALKNVRATKID